MLGYLDVLREIFTLGYPGTEYKKRKHLRIKNAFTVPCISLETLIVTYYEIYNFQHGLADV